MKTASPRHRDDVAAIVRLVDEAPAAVGNVQQVASARSFAEPLLVGELLDSGEPALGHADAVAEILRGIGASPALCAASFLIYAADHLGKPDEVIGKAFGASQVSLVSNARQLMQIQRAAQGAQVANVNQAARSRQTERVRKMLLAFSHDLRVVLLRLASRLQTLRWHAASKTPCPRDVATETQQVFAPLANRLGIGQIKWELEDLSFRYLQPDDYRAVAALLDERRDERERHVDALRARLAADLAAHGVEAEVQGRPKHIYSIWKKMQAKRLAFDAVHDVRALRVIVDDVANCYAVLGRVHALYPAVTGEFDDYIAKPKPNGYRSLHTVVIDTDGRPVEIQIRTREMHDQAEYGVSAHWLYKEASSKEGGGKAGSVRAADASASEYAARMAAARMVVLRQLLAWQREFVTTGEGDAVESGSAATPVFDDRIYVFTPQAAIVELTAGSTPIDFAYAVHTELGHRCRGAKVDGAIVSLDTALKNGQTVEVIAAKNGGPSLDWLNPELGFMQSARSRTKVRAWFNAQAQGATVARGREAVEKLLQREGKTAVKLVDLAALLGFRSADALFEVVGKDELSLRSIETLLRPAEPAPDEDSVPLRRSRSADPSKQGGVLVVGVGSLLTSLARCCRPAPPDRIEGYVTRGKGVAVHRTSCTTFRDMARRAPERVIPVAWGAPDPAKTALYPVDVQIEATDRHGLLRDVSEVLAKEMMNVVGVNTQSVRDGTGGTAFMTFTVEVPDANRLATALAQVARVDGVRAVRRK